MTTSNDESMLTYTDEDVDEATAVVKDLCVEEVSIVARPKNKSAYVLLKGEQMSNEQTQEEQKQEVVPAPVDTQQEQNPKLQHMVKAVADIQRKLNLAVSIAEEGIEQAMVKSLITQIEERVGQLNLAVEHLEDPSKFQEVFASKGTDAIRKSIDGVDARMSALELKIDDKFEILSKMLSDFTKNVAIAPANASNQVTKKEVQEPAETKPVMSNVVSTPNAKPAGLNLNQVLPRLRNI